MGFHANLVGQPEDGKVVELEDDVEREIITSAYVNVDNTNLSVNMTQDNCQVLE